MAMLKDRDSSDTLPCTIEKQLQEEERYNTFYPQIYKINGIVASGASFR